MLTRLMTASALAGGLLMVMLQAPAQALPIAKTDVAKSGTVTLVGDRGGHGGMGGGGGGGQGLRIGGGGGVPHVIRGDGPRIVGGGGVPRAAFRGDGPRFQGGGGVPRVANRGDGGPKVWDRGSGGPKAWPGRKFAGDFKHRNFHKGHRKFRGYAFYGAPYVYAYSDYGRCGWLYRKAIATGNPYWWDRYYACRDGYYDY